MVRTAACSTATPVAATTNIVTEAIFTANGTLAGWVHFLTRFLGTSRDASSLKATERERFFDEGGGGKDNAGRSAGTEWESTEGAVFRAGVGSARSGELVLASTSSSFRSIQSDWGEVLGVVAELADVVSTQEPTSSVAEITLKES